MFKNTNCYGSLKMWKRKTFETVNDETKYEDCVI